MEELDWNLCILLAWGTSRNEKNVYSEEKLFQDDF